ncbi:MAG: aspartate aminotransferase [Gammaproteobacteria bacterium]|nr:MAG: aspartate aminotransferase [Gammaproteobacteria bacterium]
MKNQKTNKTQRVCHWVLEKIHWQVYLPGQRIPSVRALAQKLSVSTFTVAQAYDQLTAHGHLTAVRGSGYYVNSRLDDRAITSDNQPVTSAARLPALTENVLETSWLLSHLFSEHPDNHAPGSGQLPQSWWPAGGFQSATRRVVNQLDDFIYRYGYVQGYQPLREVFARQLDDVGIRAKPDNMVTTAGVSGAIELLVNYLLKAGDTVIVDEPCWFWIISCLQQKGLRVLSVQRHHDGPDVAQLEKILSHEKPKLYITNSVLHNPTSFNIHPAVAYQVLNLLRAHDVYLLEDDIYGAFSVGSLALRYAALDPFERVFYTGGPSKILGGNWRVGLLCCPDAHIEGVIRQKLLSNMATPELTERGVYQLWTDNAYRKHVTHVQENLLKAHEQLRPRLEAIGIAYPKNCQMGLMIWVDTGKDTVEMALAAHKAGWLLAPGHLFSPRQNTSTCMRLNVAKCSDAFLTWLAGYLSRP